MSLRVNLRIRYRVYRVFGLRLVLGRWFLGGSAEVLGVRFSVSLGRRSYVALQAWNLVELNVGLLIGE